MAGLFFFDNISRTEVCCWLHRRHVDHARRRTYAIKPCPAFPFRLLPRAFSPTLPPLSLFVSPAFPAASSPFLLWFWFWFWLWVWCCLRSCVWVIVRVGAWVGWVPGFHFRPLTPLSSVLHTRVPTTSGGVALPQWFDRFYLRFCAMSTLLLTCPLMYTIAPNSWGKRGFPFLPRLIGTVLGTVPGVVSISGSWFCVCDLCPRTLHFFLFLSLLLVVRRIMFCVFLIPWMIDDDYYDDDHVCDYDDGDGVIIVGRVRGAQPRPRRWPSR